MKAYHETDEQLNKGNGADNGNIKNGESIPGNNEDVNPAGQAAPPESPPGRCMSFEEAKAAVFKKYDKALQRLAE